MKNTIQHNFGFDEAKDSLIVKGFQEAVISVSNFEQSLQFYQIHFGWELIYKGMIHSDIHPLWQVDRTVKIEEALLRNPGTRSGYLRVVKFHDVEQRLIRSSATPWDTGGIFDLNIRVHDMDSQYLDFEKNGWNGYAAPHHYTFGEWEVSEVLMHGPDGVVFAGIQRFKPALVGFTFEKVSRIFNSSLISKDLAASRDFYAHKLGFHIFFQTTGENRPKGPNVLGIPPGINDQINVPIDIYRPDPDSYGSIELLELPQLEGQDHSTHAVPPNLGIMMLRFPVKDVEQYLSRLEKHNVKINTTASDIILEPYGRVNIITVRTTEGAWFEFIELLN